MVALTRMAGTVGYKAEGADDDYLLTVFIPEADPPPDHRRYASLDDAIAAGGLFAQFAVAGLPSASSQVDSLLKRTRAWASRQGRVAFVLMADDGNSSVLLVKRNDTWDQAASDTVYLSHLGSLTLTPLRGGRIAQSVVNDNLLQLSRFRLEYPRGFTTNCEPAINLLTGRLEVPFDANQRFFTSWPISQPFVAATDVASRPGDRYIRSQARSVSIFDTGSMAGMRQPLLADLDLYPHWNQVRDQADLTDLYLDRARFKVAAAADATGSARMNMRDTLGRQLDVALGVDESQYFCFMPAPSTVRHDTANPLEWSVQRQDTALVPVGRFPVAPAEQRGEIHRRFKLGPSNTEIIEIREQGGRPNVALEFNPRLGGGVGARSSGEPAGAFLRRSLGRFAREQGVGDAIVREIESGPYLTADFSTVWPGFVALDEHGAPSPLGSSSRRAGGAGTYSVQPDRIVRYSTSSQNATARALGYEREHAEVVATGMPFTFLDGIPPVPMGQGSYRSDLEQHLAKHRLQLRVRETGRRHSVRRDTQQVRVRDENDVPNITPQGFEVVAKPRAGRHYVLAKTEKGNASIDFSVELTHPPLEALFQQNEFLLVVPTTSISGLDNVGVRVKARVQVGDWGFNLALHKPESMAGEVGRRVDVAPNNQSIIVLKYQKGRIRDLLLDPNIWDNHDLLDEDWIVRARAAAELWLKKIDERKEERAFKVIADVVDSTDWTGVLLINPVIDIDAMPPSLQGLVAGLDLARFRGHHLGFTQNKIETIDNIPQIKKSALFGLIDYRDETGFKKPDEFEFRVETLQVLFANSEVQDFNCLLKVRMPSLFKDDVKQVKGGTPIDAEQRQSDARVFGILGRYESFIGADRKKINRYSFVYDGGITLINDDWLIFEKAVIDRIELRTSKSENLEGGSKKRIVTELVLDATVGFKDDLGSDFLGDLFGFERLEIAGLTIPFERVLKRLDTTWEFDGDFLPELPRLHFEGISLGTDPSRRRGGSLLSKFPIKFKAFRFFDMGRRLGEFKFMELFTTGRNADANLIEFGLEWDVDFGSLAAMLGLDADLKGSLIVGWLPGDRGISLGLRFDDMGGDRLDIGIGSVLRLRAGYFDIFNRSGPGTGETFIVASDLSVQVLGEDLPNSDDEKIGLLLMPDPERSLDGPMGWLTTLGAKELGFIENFVLSLGQKVKYVGAGDTPSEIITEVKELQHFSLEEDLSREERLQKSKEFRDQLQATLRYDRASEWFIALAGEAAGVMDGYALYNPPTLFGGEVGIKDFLTIAVLYKQETPQVGIYTGTLTLSDSLRSIDLGGIRIQLPRIIVKVDTDGGYAIIIGLNMDKPDDFSNAAGAEIGIFKGDGGFMYAHIHGSAFKDVPRLANPGFPSDIGHPVYSPITRIMIAARGGIGRQFTLAILSAGASITIYGIFAGTWGKLNLAHISREAQDALKADGVPGHYNKYWAEVGVMAEIFGIVDFGVTRLRMNARLLVGIGIVFETWQDTLAYVRGELSISVNWVIARFKVFGKTIEIKIRLSFSVEYRQDFVLQRGASDKYARWFQGVGTRRARIASAPILPTKLPEADWTRTPDAPDNRTVVPVLLTLDLTLNDDREARLVPLTFIPFKSGVDNDALTDPGLFGKLVSLVFDWSLLAFDVQPPGDTTSLEYNFLLGVEQAIAAHDWRSNRGSWAAAPAWTVLTEQFDFVLTNEHAGEPTGGTTFRLPQGFNAALVKTDGEVIEIRLGGTQVDGDFLGVLDGFFDDLRINTAEERGEDARPVRVARRAQRSLDDFLFEEYLESILRAVWARIVAAVRRRSDPNDRAHVPNSSAITVAELRVLLGSEATAIAGMLNRQVFSGSRVPSDADPVTAESLPLTELANQALSVDGWPGEDIATLRLTDRALGQVVEFEIDSTAEIDAIKALKPTFGEPTFEQVRPYQEVDGDRHPLAEQVPLKQEATRLGTLWSIPELLAARAYELAFGGDTREHMKVVLEPYVEGEVVPGARGASRDYVPLMLVGIPVSAIPGRPGAFEIQQVAEADRRRLDDFFDAQVDLAGVEVDFFGQESGENGRIEAMQWPNLDRAASFLGRVNLAEDPNPTAIGNALRAARSENLPLRARPVAGEYSQFLSLVRRATDTNSGGYVLHLAGWEDAEAVRVWLTVRLDSEDFKGVLPSFVTHLLTEPSGLADAGAPAAPLTLREADQQVIALGEPGVFSARLKRANPDSLYRDPTRGPDSPRNLTAVQALTALERLRGLAVGTLVNPYHKGTLPAEVLEAAGGRDVDMAKRFNLAQMDIEEGGGFPEMDGRFDLPTGPERPDPAGDESTDPYIYNWSIPAAKLIERADNDLLADDPDAEPFIYAAIGRTMRVSANFRDVFGYSVGWQLPEQVDLHGLYFDALIPLTSLSGLQVWHDVDGGTGELRLHLRFEPGAVVDGRTRNGRARLARDNGEPVPGADEDRLGSIRAAYSRAMQQLRDTNTEYHIESTLGFDGESSISLDDDRRRQLYDALDRCREALDTLRPPNPTSVTPINDLLTLRFQLSGTIPATGIARYVVRLHASRDSRLAWPEIAKLKRSKVLAVATDVPLTQLAVNGESPASRLAQAIATAFRDGGRALLRLSYTRDGRNEEGLYVLDERLVMLRLAGTRRRPAFAAIEPLGTEPYAKQEAAIWNWPERKVPPAANTSPSDWDMLPIRAFDQDAALEELLSDIDLALTPAAADELWSDGGAASRRLDELLTAKSSIAEAMPGRVLTILNDPTDADVIGYGAKQLHDNLSNSFKKRLARISSVDTILAVPLAYESIGPDGTFLLYGRIDAPDINANTANFLPAALRRDGDTGTLIVQFDARQPAERENYVAPLVFKVDHIRWDIDTDETPWGVKWLKLFEPVAVPLGFDRQGNTSVDVPVLFKRLVKKPDIAVAPPGRGEIDSNATFAEQIGSARQWAYRFDVERARAATQDDLVIDVDYNVRPEELSALRVGSRRDVGDVLFEYMAHRGELQGGGDRNLWYTALGYWASQVAVGIRVGAQMQRGAGNLERKKHEFVLREAKSAMRLDVTLEKRGEWEHDGFAFAMQEVMPSDTESNVLPSRGRQAATVLARLSIEPPATDMVTGEYFAGRRIEIDKLDMLREENAWPAVAIQRNATLGNYRNIRENFIYRTDAVRPGEPLTPLLEVPEPIQIPGGTRGTGLERLAAGLETLYEVLFNAVELDDRPLVDLAWGYDSGQLDEYKREDAGMRVFASDPIGMFTARKLTDDFSDGIDIPIESVREWERQNGGTPASGRYTFELRVYSRLARVEKPLLRLAGLYFNL